MKLAFLFLMTLLTTIRSTSLAQDALPEAGHGDPTRGSEFPEVQKLVFLELQIVDIPLSLALPIASEMMDVARIDAAHAKVQELLAKGTAKLVGWPMVISKSGQVATIEGITEIRYVTEYEPGAVNIYLDGKDGKLTLQPTRVEGVEVPSSPTAFETRNVGVTLELEPVIHPDGKRIDLRLSPQNVLLAKMNKVSLKDEKSGKEVVVEQPEFDTRKVTTNLTVVSGQRTLLGVFRTKEPADHLEFFILRAEVREVK